MKKIGADILSGMGVSNVSVGVYQDRFKADKFFETRLTLQMKEKRSRFNPVSVEVQNVILQHCQMPQFLCFEGVNSLEIKGTTEKFDLSALYNIYWENGSKKGGGGL